MTANRLPRIPTWILTKLRTDRDSRTYTLDRIRVPNVMFPELDPEKAEKAARFLEREIPKWNIHGSIDEILPALEMAKKEQIAVGQHRPAGAPLALRRPAAPRREEQCPEAAGEEAAGRTGLG